LPKSIRLDEDIAKAEIEAQRCGPCCRRCRSSKRAGGPAAARRLIEQLRQGQTGPVRVDGSTRPSPIGSGRCVAKDSSFTWTNTPLRCRAVGLRREPRASRWFKKPVDIIDSPVDQTTGDMVRYDPRDFRGGCGSAAVAAGRGASGR
jgi:hypothetical protein